MRLTIPALLLLLLAACGGGEPPAPMPTTEERLAAPPSRATGASIFRGECAVCHNAAPGAGHRVGPNLAGVVGEEAARHPDFSYSAAMRRSGLTWTEETLDAYLENPQAIVPGTRMAYRGLANEADRRDLIEWLGTTGEPATP